MSHLFNSQLHSHWIPAYQTQKNNLPKYTAPHSTSPTRNLSLTFDEHLTLTVQMSSQHPLFDGPHITSLVCSNNDSILQHFQDITTFTVYVTACDLDKSFSFKTPVEITTCTLSDLCVHTILNMRVRKVLTSKSNLQVHSKSSLDRPHRISNVI